MISSPCGQLKQGAAGAFCMLLAMVAVAPEKAWAGCGHQVTSTASRSVSSYQSGLETFEIDGIDNAEPPPADSQRRLPCSGPSCSEGRKVPLVPAPNSSVRSELWGNTHTGSSWERPGLAHNLETRNALRPRSTTSPIERPPR